jgi:hypothetical protein
VSISNVSCNNLGFSKILGSVPCSASPSGIIYYNNFTQSKNVFKNHNLSELTIELKDDSFNYIDFSNVNWTMTLQIDVLNEVVHDSVKTLDDVYKSAKEEIY